MYKAYISVSLQAALLFFITAMAAAFAPEFAFAAEPIEVRGDRAEYSADGRRAEFDGNVVLQSGGTTVHAGRLVVSVFAEGNQYFASGEPVRAECGECSSEFLQISAKEIRMRDDAEQTIFAGGGLTLCAGESCARGRLIAESAEWRRATEELHLRGAPINGFWTPPDGGEAISLRAVEAEYAGQSGDVRLSGGAVVARGAEEIRGDSIVFNIRTGAIHAAGGDDGGRVRGVFGGDSGGDSSGDSDGDSGGGDE